MKPGPATDASLISGYSFISSTNFVAISIGF